MRHGESSRCGVFRVSIDILYTFCYLSRNDQNGNSLSELLKMLMFPSSPLLLVLVIGTGGMEWNRLEVPQLQNLGRQSLIGRGLPANTPVFSCVFALIAGIASYVVFLLFSCCKSISLIQSRVHCVESCNVSPSATTRCPGNLG